MRRVTILAMIAGTAALLWGSAGAALAGGGCHGGATHGTDTTVVISGACFHATITSVAPGTTVTFLNKDPFAHNVTANTWGHFDDLNQGDTFEATFEAPGIYPFACTYHPGMSGAIVVGDGSGAGNGSAVFVEENTAPPATKSRVASAADESAGASWGWIAGAGVLGLAAGSALTIGLTRTRKTQPAG
jgi:plastocyanin